MSRGLSQSQTAAVTLDAPLGWRELAAVADGAPLRLSSAAEARIGEARRIVEAIVDRGVRAYGVNTGVGALCDVVVPRERQQALSRAILMSHAVGVGEPLDEPCTRALLAAAINNYAHGRSGIRLEVVRGLLAMLDAGCLPVVPAGGSVGYLTHMAHAALLLVGEGQATFGGRTVPGAEALGALGAVPLVLEAKEGLSLVNGTPCATGIGTVALARARRLLDWADVAAALTFEALGGQIAAFDPAALALRRSDGLQLVGRRLRDLLAGSSRLAAAQGSRTQDPLSLRAVPHVHGAARDTADHAGAVIDRELASVTDNPLVGGTPEAPAVFSEAHAVGAALGLAFDSLAVALAEVVAMSERRIDRLVNPLVSGLPAFLAREGGVASGFMIAQYTAAALVAENRRLAAPASLDGGITSGLQEDHLSHATPAAGKLLAITGNALRVLSIELLAACQAHDLSPGGAARAAGTEQAYQWVRARCAPYRDDRPLAGDIEAMAERLRDTPDDVAFPGRSD